MLFFCVHIIYIGTLYLRRSHGKLASTRSLVQTWCIQRLWYPISITASKLPVSLMPQREAMGKRPFHRLRDSRPILPQILFMRNITIKEEERKSVEFRHSQLSNIKSATRKEERCEFGDIYGIFNYLRQFAFLLYARDLLLEVWCRIC